MKAILMIEYESEMKELVRILAENGYEVNVKKTGYWWEHKYQVEVSKALEKIQKGESSNESRNSNRSC